MLGIGKPGHVGEVAVLHAQALRLRVHARDEHVLGAAHRFRQRDRRIVARLHDHAMQQLVHGYRFLGLDEHARAFRLPRSFRHVHHLRGRDLLLSQRLEHQIGGHELGERRRLAPLPGVLHDQELMAREIGEEIGLRGDHRQRHRRRQDRSDGR